LWQKRVPVWCTVQRDFGVADHKSAFAVLCAHPFLRTRRTAFFVIAARPHCDFPCNEFISDEQLKEVAGGLADVENNSCVALYQATAQINL